MQTDKKRAREIVNQIRWHLYALSTGDWSSHTAEEIPDGWRGAVVHGNAAMLLDTAREYTNQVLAVMDEEIRKGGK